MLRISAFPRHAVNVQASGLTRWCSDVSWPTVREIVDERFACGVVLYDGAVSVLFGQQRSLWTLARLGACIGGDAVVNAEGCELITRDVPVAVQEIEALMRG